MGNMGIASDDVASFVKGLARDMKLNTGIGERFISEVYLRQKEISEQFAWAMIEYLHRTWDDRAREISKGSRDVILEGTVLYLDKLLGPDAEGSVHTKLMLEVLRDTAQELVEADRNPYGPARIENLVEIDGAIGSKKVGFCIDTCHAFAAGYDIRSKEVIENIVNELGNSKIDIVHLNDAKFGLGSKKDWHANIGFGEIGKKGIEAVVRSSLGKKVLILETPVGESIGEEAEIRLVEKMFRKE